MFRVECVARIVFEALIPMPLLTELCPRICTACHQKQQRSALFGITGLVISDLRKTRAIDSPMVLLWLVIIHIWNGLC